MFKHLSVGKKMAVGYGVQIILILLCAFIAYISAVNRSATLDRSDKLTRLQGAVSTELKVFNEARLLADTVIEEIDHEAYAAFEEQVEAVQAGLETVAARSAAAEDRLQEDVEILRDYVSEWSGHVAAAQRYNLRLEEQADSLEALLERLSQSGGELFQEVLRDEAAADSGRHAVLVGEVFRLCNQIEQIRVDSTPALVVFATEDISPVLERVDGALALAAQIGGETVGRQSRSRLSAVEELLIQYRQAFFDYARVSEESEELHELAAYELGGEISTRLVTLSNRSEELLSGHIQNAVAVYQSALAYTLVIAVLAVAGGVLIALRITARITKPLGRVNGLLVQVGETGSLELPAAQQKMLEADRTSRDEVGQAAKALDKLLSRLRELDRCLGQVAQGNMTADVQPLGEQDTMALSLNDMTGNLNNLLGEIERSGETVSSSATELAAASENLAQNNTEQSAAAQELRASVSQVAAQAQRGKELSGLAVNHSALVCEKARAGSRKMQDMVRAMRDINTAGHSIQQVVKAIDDIAFQTNILALNAAVEAAHAGSAGKGFSIVAGEVRALAAKSAEAAQDTAAFIEKALPFTENGIHMSDEAANVFAEIAEGVERTGRDLAEIAGILEEQSYATRQIDKGIGQVTDSVQQNSSTSEETAATSEELSAQALQLHGLIGRFTLSGASLRHTAPSISYGDDKYGLPDPAAHGAGGNYR